ncbi:MAG: GGDEF domain-containing protein, partial [Rhizobacter sp.]
HRGRSYWQALTRLAPAAGALPGAVSLLFQGMGATRIALCSLAFTALWGVIYGLLRGRYNRPAVLLVWVAICGHSTLATLGLGWDSGFHYYVLLMVPVMFVSPGRRDVTRVLLGVLLAVFYVALDVMARRTVPLEPIAPGALDWVRFFNMVSTFFVLGYLAHVYFGVVGVAESHLRALATTDPLTGLANRRRILDVANYEIQRGRREGTPLSFVLGDVDHFKRINDGRGHETGDQVLMAMAGVLRTVVRERDTVARWGGEEFLVVLPETALDEAMRVAERARVAMEAGVWPDDRPVTMTLGVSQWRDGETLAEAVARADEALYRGKHAGRNRSVLERPAVQPNSLPSSPARR